MINKPCILFLAFLLFLPFFTEGQEAENDGVSFSPSKGEWQISLLFGNGTFFRQYDGMNYLLPTHGGQSVGLPGEGNQSGDPGMYLNLGTIGENSVVNIAGIQVKYFLTERWSLNAMFSMNISLTPKKDFVSGDASVPEMPVPAYKYVEGRMNNSWMANVGSDYYFRTKNARINPYLGAVAGFQMARLETNTPYTGETVTDPGTGEEQPVELYRSSHRSGQIWGMEGSLVAGIEFSLMKGLVLGFEVRPVSYNYSRIQIKPSGMSPYEADHHNIRLFTLPNLKLGMRF